MTKVQSGGSKLIYCKYSWKKAATKLQIRLVQALHCLIKGIEREVAGPQKTKLWMTKLQLYIVQYSVQCTVYTVLYSVQCTVWRDSYNIL